MKTAEEILIQIAGKKYVNNNALLTDEVLKAMEEYAEQFKPKWISVEDELPKNGNDVLVTDGEACMVTYYRDFKKQWEFSYIDWWTSKDVTHWMPIPKIND